LREQFSALLTREKRLFRGPYVEMNPPFKPGETVRRLIERGVLGHVLLRIPAETLLPDRPLYLHQQHTIEKVQAGRNVIVATGTGSGKTEAYLLPIVDHVLSEQARKGTLSHGIRALLVYPMNALANDQLKRLRHLLRNCPEVTFGRYIGDTPTERDQGLGLFRQTWPNEPDIRNELKSREEMWASPPHILITNFAMLEYLLVRPRDSVFFESGASELLRFLVLDEIHTYDGAKGTEIAMLLRRLKQRVGFTTSGCLRCIGTSATLGGGRDLPDIAEFASKLFDEPFVHNLDGEPQDVVQDVRIPHSRPKREWGPLPPGLYREMEEIAALPSENAMKTLEERIKDPENGIPEAVQAKVLERAADAVSDRGRTSACPTLTDKDAEEWNWGPSSSPVSQTDGVAEAPFPLCEAFYELLRGDRRVALLKDICSTGAREAEEILNRVFPEPELGQDERRRALLSLLAIATVAAPANGEPPLLTTRYHLFLRSMEGCFVCLQEHQGGGPRLFLERRTTCPEHPDSRVFEIGVCRRCGEEILVGSLVMEADGMACVTSEDPTQEMLVDYDDMKRQRIFLSFRTEGPPQLNEDELVDEQEDAGDGETELPRLKLCLGCGALTEPKRPRECKCRDRSNTIDVVRIPPRGMDLKLCPSCGSRSLHRDLLQTVYTGPDEPVAETAITLFQSTNEPYVYGHAGKKKILTFSDSRADAAYFAPYLESVYRTTLRRHVLLSCVENDTEPIPLEDLALRISRMIKEKNWLGEAAGPEVIRTEAWRWVVGEVLHASKDRRSLEEIGAVDFVLNRFSQVRVPPPLLKPPWNLSEEEAWTLIQVLLDTLRDAYVLSLPPGLERDDEVFAPARADVSVALKRAPKDRRTIAWVPQNAASSNTRLDYLKRLARKRGLPFDDQYLRNFLAQLFERYLTSDKLPVLSHYFDRNSTDAQRGTLFQLALRGWVLVPPKSLGQAYRCSRCGLRTYHSISGVCPTYCCDGILEIEQPGEFPDRSDHYRARYQDFLDLWMVAREHTAQLDSLTAASFQNLFYMGGIDVLSCSTTFELGVDLGELETILMRNVPPTPANYAQRAGRAGRRSGATAFVVTYAQRRSHDLTHYNQPIRMISGRVRPPAFRIDNERIVRRHVYATALGAFFQKEPRAFGSGRISDLFGAEAGTPEHVTALEAFLRERPQPLFEALQRIVPLELQGPLGIKDWGWVAEFLEGSHFSIKTALEEYRRDCDYYRSEEKKASEGAKHDQARLYQRIRKTIETRHLLGVLANRGLFPKYGFPVDVVNLNIHPEAIRRMSRGGEGAQLDDIGLELSRDLKLAIAEYAPGCEVVAGGAVWRSVGLKVMPQRSLEEISYVHCPCGAIQILKPGAAAGKCHYCGQSNQKAHQGRYVRPEFGFVTSKQAPPKATTRRPGRQYATRIAFAEYIAKEPFEFVEMWNGVLVGRPQPARLVSINMGKAQRGFRFCQECGFAEPLAGKSLRSEREHPRPWGGNCRARLTAPVDLGHDFITDVLELRLHSPLVRDGRPWWSVAYAILEGATSALGVKRDDLDVTLRPVGGGGQSVFLFDTVPGGAGHVVRIHEHLGLSLRHALSRVASCSCEETTSCYECLRTFGNQRLHSYLERGTAKRFLERALGHRESMESSERPLSADRDALDLVPDHKLRDAIRRLVVAGIALPEVGFELVDDQGAVLSEAELAWPAHRVAVLEGQSYDAFVSAGWKAFSPEEVVRNPGRLSASLV